MTTDQDKLSEFLGRFGKASAKPGEAPQRGGPSGCEPVMPPCAGLTSVPLKS
jgi:hypothetical protein